jgi:hypothetical protein
MKTYNAHKARPFVIMPQKAVDDTAAVASAFTDWKSWFNFDSQNPSIVLANGDYQIHIRGAVNFLDNKKEDGDFIFYMDNIAHKDLSRMNIKAKLRNVGSPDLSDDDAQKLLDFAQPGPGAGKNAPKVETGLHLLCFAMRKNKKVQALYTGPPPQPALIMAPEVHNLVELLNKTAPIFTLLRQSRFVLSDVDDNWCNRIRCVVDKGLLPFYKGIVRQVNSFQFADWIKNPEKHLAHQPWMRLKTQKQDGSFTEYASHPGKSLFSDMKEWETILSVALIHEIEYENMCNKATFSHTMEHEAQVIHKSGKYIQIAVSVKRHPTVPTPTFPPGSRFSISKGTAWVEKPAAGDDEMEDAPAPPPPAVVEEDDEMVDAPAQSSDSRVFTPGLQPKPLGDILVKKPANQRLRKQAAATAAELAAAASVRLPKSRSPSPSLGRSRTSPWGRVTSSRLIKPS